MRDYPILHLDTNINEHERVSNITLDTNESKETACKLRDVTEHERVSNITLRHKYK